MTLKVNVSLIIWGFEVGGLSLWHNLITIKNTLMALRIEVGKKYWTRDGQVADVQHESLIGNYTWPFLGRIKISDNLYVSATWRRDGRFGNSYTFGLDLVSEYHKTDQTHNNQNTQL